MKVVAITDKKGSAIDRLARMNERRLPHLRYVVCPLHPKRPSPEELANLERELEDADLVDAQYWKSAMTMLAKFPQYGHLPIVISHQNEHNINDTAKDHWPWKDRVWAMHVAKNGWQRGELKKQGINARLIHHAIEFDNFSYLDKLTTDKVVGYVGQVKKVKGVLQLAQACQELGYKLLLVGSVSEASVWAELQQRYADTVVTAIPGTLSVPDEMVGSVYHRMRVYCANSDDGTESGTMPILEAMLSGIPVVTRRIGLVRDCGKNQANMVIRDGSMVDIPDLKRALQMVMENDDVANSLREAAWRTVRQYHPDRQARLYETTFREVLHPKETSVSIIMPTCKRNAEVLENLLSIREQTYKNIEVVICDDNRLEDSMQLKAGIEQIRPRLKFPVKWVWTGKRADEYGLAKARNLGLIEATGDIVVFCDDRLRMHPGAVEAFVKALKNGAKADVLKMWVWGSKKQGQFKTFVENFSATWRSIVINGGMFNERMDAYGGMTQEVSGRFGSQGLRFEFCPGALAEPMIGTHSRSRHRADIINSKIKLYKMGLQ